jgi:hypothetical protein
MTARDEFLAGERPDDVALFLADSFLDGDLDDVAAAVEDGWVLVVSGEQGRSVFSRLTGMDAMGFARRAGDQRTHVHRDLTGGDCPADGDGDDHSPAFVFAFVEAQNEEVGGLYAEGPVVHAYAHCTCGENYSERWVAGDD